MRCLKSSDKAGRREQLIDADVAELADALDLGSSIERCECSSHFVRTILKLNTPYAEVAELADALDSGSSGSNTEWVQVPSPAPVNNPESTIAFRIVFYLYEPPK